ncbi:uncharacterized protein VTP21DRAFT_1527 [Calcarisporiella thermophila]|uniref:uncharacterized protein n=1 Tax=Calcarisporiella thermophila TaxID=911321 RepID=UPI0037428CED
MIAVGDSESPFTSGQELDRAYHEDLGEAVCSVDRRSIVFSTAIEAFGGRLHSGEACIHGGRLQQPRGGYHARYGAELFDDLCGGCVINTYVLEYGDLSWTQLTTALAIHCGMHIYEQHPQECTEYSLNRAAALQCHIVLDPPFRTAGRREDRRSIVFGRRLIVRQQYGHLR